MNRPRIAALALLACVGCRKPAPPPDVVAESRSGPVRFEEVERALENPARAGDRAGGRSQAQATDQVALYRRAAEDLVVERAILAEVPDLDAALEELGAEHERLRREAILDLFNLEQDRAKPIRLEPEETRSYYDAHTKEFHRPAVRVVWHLFRRDEDPAHPEATMAFLASLKKRVGGGEAFSLLAREYSQSETRLLDGRLGTLGRGRLPKALDDVVFSLPRGGVSDPIRVKGGAVLLHVSHLVEEKQFPFDDVRVIIARRLGEKKRQERISEALGDTPPPEGAVLLDSEALSRQVESGDPAEVVLQVGARKVTVKDFRELLEKERPDEAESLPRSPLPERISENYGRLQREALLVAKLEAEGFDKAPQREAALRERVRRQGLRLVVGRRLEERIWKKVDAAADPQKRFYQENRFLYQSPLRIKIWTLSVGGPDLARKAAELATLREALEKGRIDLEAAAARIGGRVDDGGWLEPAALATMEPKVRSYLLEMNGPGYSVPFQLNRRLSLIRVEKRDEPRVLAFDEVKDRVRQDYHERRQQELYREVVSELLRAEVFRFNEDAVKRALAAPAAKAAPPASPA